MLCLNLFRTAILIVCSFIFFQCTNFDVTSTTIIPGRNYIPFVEFNSEGERKWGYLDENTGEIVINAKYAFAYPFVGGYAQVGMDWHDKMLIDRTGKNVNVGYFDQIYLFASESGRHTLAILEKVGKRTRFSLGLFGGSTGFYTEDKYTYHMVNLVTGKTIIPSKENYLYMSIDVVGDYFLVRPDYGKVDLYQFLDNGEVERIVQNDPVKAASILKDYLEGRGINAEVKHDDDITIDYKPYIKKIFSDTDFRAALKDVPSELTFKSAKPFYQDYTMYLNAPLEISEKKYKLHFSLNGSYDYIEGIYNYSKAEWEILPKFFLEHEDGKKVFYYTIEIEQTNNPNLYYLQFTNEEIGWYRQAQVAGGLYSLLEKDYMTHLYLYERYPPREGVILSTGGSGSRIINYPDKGVYYRDYGRIK